MTTNVEISCPTSDEASFENEAKRKSIQISERPSDLLSKEGFALYIGKTHARWLKWLKQESCQPST